MMSAVDYIGRWELVFFVALVAGVCLYIDSVDESPVPEAAVDTVPSGDGSLRVMDGRFVPYVIDSLSAWADSSCTYGWLTVSKRSGLYTDLLGDSAGWCILTGMGRYLPDGMLLRVVSVRQNDSLLQIHFRPVTDGDGMLGELSARLDSISRSGGATGCNLLY